MNQQTLPMQRFTEQEAATKQDLTDGTQDPSPRHNHSGFSWIARVSSPSLRQKFSIRWWFIRPACPTKRDRDSKMALADARELSRNETRKARNSGPLTCTFLSMGQTRWELAPRVDSDQAQGHLNSDQGGQGHWDGESVASFFKEIWLTSRQILHWI